MAKRKGLFFISCVVLVSVTACKSTKVTHTTNALPFSFLEGFWRANDDGLAVYEHWDRHSDHTLTAHTVTVQENNDTLSDENVAIKKEGKEFVYQLMVRDMGAEFITPYPITHYSDSSFVCENSEQEFPKRITYQLEKNGILKMIADDGYNPPKEKYEFLFNKMIK